MIGAAMFPNSRCSAQADVSNLNCHRLVSHAYSGRSKDQWCSGGYSDLLYVVLNLCRGVEMGVAFGGLIKVGDGLR